MESTKYISDFISEEEILSWKPGENIVITSGTGTGKTTFIQKKLDNIAAKYNKRIVELEPRKALKEQQIESAKNCKALKITSYQNYKAEIGRLDKYDYVVLDEGHYPFTDSSVNDLSNDFFVEAEKLNNTVKIWMTATPEELINYFETYNIPYKQYEGIKSNTKIGELFTFDTDEELSNILDISLIEGMKIMYICNDSSKLMRIYKNKKYHEKTCLVLGNSHPMMKQKKRNGKYIKSALQNSVDEETKYIAENRKFSNRLLLSTSAMDCGVSLEDYDFNVIIIDGIFDINEIQQIAGRKRALYNTDTCSLFVRNISNKRLNGFNTSVKKSIKMVNYLAENGEQQYVEWKRNKIGTKVRDPYEVVYDCFDGNGNIHKTINEMKYFHLKSIIARTEKMIGQGKNGLKKTLEATFGLKVKQWTIDATPVIDDILARYYEMGKFWKNKTETLELATELGFTTKYGRPAQTREAINGVLKYEYESAFRINKCNKRFEINGKSKQHKNTWYVVRKENFQEENLL